VTLSARRTLIAAFVLWSLQALILFYTAVNVYGFRYGAYEEGPAWMDRQMWTLFFHTVYLGLASTVFCLIATVGALLQYGAGSKH
jgi:ABC-type Fe3+ transport system permease subunit